MSRCAALCGCGGFALVVITALLGPSAAVVPVGRTGWYPLAWSADPSPWLVAGLLAGAVALSAAALALALGALRRGWAPAPRRLLALSFAAVGVLTAVAPVASADVLSYTGYGRIAALGHDPYAVSPAVFARDPVVRAVEPPWQSTPTIYGPLATAEQAAVARVAGPHLATAVGLLDLINGVAFAVTGWLLYRLAGPADRQRRAVLLYGLNPLLLFAVVAGGHVDSLAALAVVGALGLTRRSPVWAGIVVGAGGLIKLTVGLPAFGWAWLERRSFVRLTALGAGAGAVVLAGYSSVGLHAFTQARRASRFVSIATPWRPIRAALQQVVSHATASSVVSVGGFFALGAVALVLARRLPDDTDDRPEARYARAALVAVLAWTMTAPYVLSWYDAVPWALLALLAASRYDRLLLVHTAVLAIVYLPGRTVPLPHALATVTTDARAAVAPAILLAVVVMACLPDRAPPNAVVPAGGAVGP